VTERAPAGRLMNVPSAARSARSGIVFDIFVMDIPRFRNGRIAALDYYGRSRINKPEIRGEAFRRGKSAYFRAPRPEAADRYRFLTLSKNQAHSFL